MKIKRINPNHFAAYDEDGRCVGKSSIQKRDLNRIYPDCPVEYRITISCDEESRDLLCGAAVTRARILAAKETEPCRVCAEVRPEDRELLALLESLGFRVNDSLTRMSRSVDSAPVVAPIPKDCTIVRDFLENKDEFEKCLKRYNECFGTKCSREWLKAITEKPDFVRILMVSPAGLCGELLAWSSGSSGVIGTLQVARGWRRMGVATYLMEDVRKYFSTLNLRTILFDARVSAPGVVPLAKKTGYRPSEPLILYPELF